jgi:hypothetical protein
MNHKVQEKVEGVICECFANTAFARRAKDRGLSSQYVANQISALIGELCGDWADRNYMAEKLRNAKSQIDNILEGMKWKI